MNQRGLINLLISFFILASSLQSSGIVTANQQVIPDEAIRLRILANSNSNEDQTVKRSIRDEVNESINEWVADLTSIEESRHVIKSRLAEIEAIVSKQLEMIGSRESFSVTFGEVAFPTKLYGDFVYPAGDYEAVLITIGEGLGDNWWCVLFPPLCFLDFSNGDAVQAESDVVEEPSEEVEVEFFLVKIIDAIVEWIKEIFS
ncbi:stage II sporulation protein R [Guptibacillus hwajinpoensis]|uniref:stage II sporulation protein R n=1 Tax=Guptibacillus hwajinpoensis TaxID=208199 RepID=UPI001CFEBF5E|nr:stage II sporulation protein R [Pseudalkalibacillus hwajinpoensis]WLR61672.1 stage II sporulation protein R [Pseudalkalibacillus hwajinpoensis]